VVTTILTKTIGAIAMDSTVTISLTMDQGTTILVGLATTTIIITAIEMVLTMDHDMVDLLQLQREVSSEILERPEAILMASER